MLPMNGTFLPGLNPLEGNDDDHDAHLLRCWRIQDCKGCLSQPDCSWCPFSWTCIPNSYRMPLLAPAWDENICPHWAERWEIRTRPLGCQVSTITTLTSLVTIASTLVFVLVVMSIVLATKKMWAYGQKRPGFWRVWEYDWRAQALSLREQVGGILGKLGIAGTGNHAGENEPLLPSSRNEDVAS
ncbi:hypothetical protein F4775DRAFT_594168 [Biscogniauxia sp. FL1348]|nr:hypothetical protein F4775DRAFT_594168 [Biscogniauxia sp. FL1348]